MQFKVCAYSSPPNPASSLQVSQRATVAGPLPSPLRSPLRSHRVHQQPVSDHRHGRVGDAGVGEQRHLGPQANESGRHLLTHLHKSGTRGIAAW